MPQAVTDEKRKTVVPPITLEGIERKAAAIFPRSPQAMKRAECNIRQTRKTENDSNNTIILSESDNF
jgi:hypothetical protein